MYRISINNHHSTKCFVDYDADVDNMLSQVYDEVMGTLKPSEHWTVTKQQSVLTGEWERFTNQNPLPWASTSPSAS